MKTIRMLAALAALCAAALQASAAFPNNRVDTNISGTLSRNERAAYEEKLGANTEQGRTELNVLRVYAVESERFARITADWLRKDPVLVKALVDGLRGKAAEARAAKRVNEASAYEAAAIGIERQAKEAAVIASSRSAVAAAVKLLEAKP